MVLQNCHFSWTVNENGPHIPADVSEDTERSRLIEHDTDTDEEAVGTLKLKDINICIEKVILFFEFQICLGISYIMCICVMLLNFKCVNVDT